MRDKVSNTRDRLKELMEDRNLRSVDILNLVRPICQKYNVKLEKNNLSQYLSGAVNPGQDKTLVLAEALGVDVAWLMGLDVPMTKNLSLPSNMKPYNPIMHKIPILGHIAAGMPIFAEEHIEGYTYTEHNGGAEYFALKVNGDSMTAANIPDGSLAIVRRQPSVENGEIAAVRVNNENATIKRFKQDKNIIQLIPQSYNPGHQIQIYDLKKDNLEIVGKVVECKVEFG